MKMNLSFKFYLVGLILLSLQIPLCAEESSCSYGQFNVGAEWLYWKVKQDNLRAGSFIDDFPNPTLKIANAVVIQPGFEFNNGIL